MLTLKGQVCFFQTVLYSFEFLCWLSYSGFKHLNARTPLVKRVKSFKFRCQFVQIILFWLSPSPLCLEILNSLCFSFRMHECVDNLSKCSVHFGGRHYLVNRYETLAFGGVLEKLWCASQTLQLYLSSLYLFYNCTIEMRLVCGHLLG